MVETIFQWNKEGTDVKIAGSFNDWKPEMMIKENNKWIYKINLEQGEYIYKFIIDNVWCFNSDLPNIKDENDNSNNIIIIKNKTNIFNNHLSELENEENKISEMIKQLKDKEEYIKKEKIRMTTEKLENEKLEKERIEKERIENEKREEERIEKERIEKEENHKLKIKEEYSDEYFKIKAEEIINVINIGSYYITFLDKIRENLISNKIIGCNKGPTAGWTSFFVFINIYGEIFFTANEYCNPGYYPPNTDLKPGKNLEISPKNFIEEKVISKKLIEYFLKDTHYQDKDLAFLNSKVGEKKNIWELEKTKLILTEIKKDKFTKYNLVEEEINDLLENINTCLPIYKSFSEPINEIELIDKLKKLKIIDIISFTTGPNENIYNVNKNAFHIGGGVGPNYINDKVISYEINVNFIDIDGKIYHGKTPDTFSYYRQSPWNSGIISRSEFNDIIFKKTLENPPKEKFTDNIENKFMLIANLIRNEAFLSVKNCLTKDLFCENMKKLNIDFEKYINNHKHYKNYKSCLAIINFFNGMEEYIKNINLWGYDILKEIKKNFWTINYNDINEMIYKKIYDLIEFKNYFEIIENNILTPQSFNRFAMKILENNLENIIKEIIDLYFNNNLGKIERLLKFWKDMQENNPLNNTKKINQLKTNKVVFNFVSNNLSNNTNFIKFYEKITDELFNILPSNVKFEDLSKWYNNFLTKKNQSGSYYINNERKENMIIRFIIKEFTEEEIFAILKEKFNDNLQKYKRDLLQYAKLKAMGIDDPSFVEL